jgi:hypothetical protein
MPGASEPLQAADVEDRIGQAAAAMLATVRTTVDCYLAPR